MQPAQPTLADAVQALDALYPPDSAQSWDQVGLVSGDLAQPVERVLFAVDPTLAVIEEARSLGADLLVTHHPLLLRGIHSVATTSAKGASVTALVVHDIALYVAHTNADVADPGVNDALAAACGLSAVTQVVKMTGFVASDPGFTGQPQVVNGASELLLEVFGEAGRHARSAVGISVLPFDAPVEIELIVEVSASPYPAAPPND